MPGEDEGIWLGLAGRGYGAAMTAATTEQPEASASSVPTPQEQRVLAAKIAVGFVVGTVMAGVIGPIVLAIFVGLVTGHT